MIYFDVTKAGVSRHRSGLMRVSSRLRKELGDAVSPVRWPVWEHEPRSRDWYLTTELFSEAERPGFAQFLTRHPCRLAAVFHDAIPLKWPHITWPQSVARHPGYMKLLAEFDHVWAVSAASKCDLEGFWRWQGLTRTPPVDVLALGADFNVRPRKGLSDEPRAEAEASRVNLPRRLLCVGILEPRKNQLFLLEACDRLWEEGMRFELHFVGRVNPHFGAPVLARIKEIARKRGGLVTWHAAIDDAGLEDLYATTRATVFPTIAEGCGLPLLESLWMGVPCVCSDLPVLRENATGGGCLPVATNDLAAWTQALRSILTDDSLSVRLTTEARTRALPRWAETTAALRTVLAD